MSLLLDDKHHLGRDVSALPLEVVGSDGSYLIDVKGQRYLDFLMGWCVGNIGWGNKQIRQTINDFVGPEYVNPYYLYRPWVELAKLLVKISPGKMTKAFRATSGTEAVDIALQAARNYTKRDKFVVLNGAYHGHSLGNYSFVNKDFSSLSDFGVRVNPPLNKETALKIVKILSHGDIAAYISEPVVCNWGVEVPTRDYFEIIQKACQKYGVVFIIDEVATGFGRTGKMFACEHYNLEPDIICLGKGLTGGYGALAATLMTASLAKSMEFNFSYYSTFGWHPLNVCATLANLKYLIKNKNKILKNVNKMSFYFEKRLLAMKFKYSTEVRVKGLAVGLRFTQAGYSGELENRCFAKKLLVSRFDDTMLTIFPALNINLTTAKKGLDVFESCL